MNNVKKTKSLIQDSSKRFSKIIPLGNKSNHGSSKNLIDEKLYVDEASIAKREKAKRFEYIPDRIPPNFRIAQEHSKAMRVGPGKEVSTKKQIRLCPCCSRKVERDKLSLCCSATKLAYIGSGYPLYYIFLKFCSFFLVLILVSSGMYNLYTNYFHGTTCQDDIVVSEDGESQQSSQCELNFITRFSIGNKSNQKTLIHYQDIFNFASIILMIIMFQFFRVKTKKVDQDCDVADIAATDYTVLIKNIPLEYDAINNDYDDDLKFWIENKLFTDNQIKIFDVNLAYKMENLFEYKQQQQQIIKWRKKEMMHYYKHGEFYNHSFVELDEMYKNSLENQDSLLNKFHQGRGKKFMKEHFTGWAFVTVQTEEQKQILINCMQDPNKKLFSKQKEIIYQGQKIEIEAAPDPTDVFWDNLHIGNHRLREFRSLILGIMWIMLCFFIVYPIVMQQKVISKEYQANLEKQKQNQTSTITNNSTSIEDENNNLDTSDSDLSFSNLTNQLYLQALAVTISLIITILNALSYNIIIKITDSERQWTRTLYNISAIKMLSFTQFIISAMITFIIEIFLVQQDSQSNFQKIFGRGGLVYNQNYVFIFNSVTPFIIELADLEGFYKKFVRQRLFQKVDDGVPILYTQSELNSLFENPEFDIIRRYSDCLKTMYMCAFYAPIIPFSLIWCFIAIVLHFWVDKYNLLRRRVIRYNMSSDLSIEMTEMLEFVLIIYCLGNMVFSLFILEDSDSISIWLILGVVIGIFHAGLPMDKVNNVICPLKQREPNRKPIEEVELQFLTDYARENPATTKVATAQFLQKLQELRDLEQQKRKEEYIREQFMRYNNNVNAQPILSSYQPDLEDQQLNSNRTNKGNTERQNLLLKMDSRKSQFSPTRNLSPEKLLPSVRRKSQLQKKSFIFNENQIRDFTKQDSKKSDKLKIDLTKNAIVGGPGKIRKQDSNENASRSSLNSILKSGKNTPKSSQQQRQKKMTFNLDMEEGGEKQYKQTHRPSKFQKQNSNSKVKFKKEYFKL